MTIALILGSGPNAIDCRDWPRAPFTRIVAINNAWQVRPDWDDVIFPEDFDRTRLPKHLTGHQTFVEAAAYVPAQNALGGFVWGGGTMAFTAGYYALHALRPKVIAYLGCDMVYPDRGETHFYGTGTPDPLRDDVTLRSLEAKSARLMVLAARQGCALVNLSGSDSRLVFPRATPSALETVRPRAFDPARVDAILAAERAQGYEVPSGRYWLEEDRFDPEQIDRIDALWLEMA